MKKTIIGILKKLESKGLITVKQQGLNKPNIYTIRDFSGIWKAGSSEEIEEVKKKHFVDLTEVSTDVLLEELRRRDKEKELDQTEPTKVTVEPSTKLNQFDIVNTTINS